MTVGGTLFTTNSKVAEVEPPLLSVTVMVTVWLSAGPLVASNDQLQVPSPLMTTLPTDALNVGSPAVGSVNVPVLVAVWPSSTLTVVFSTVSSASLSGTSVVVAISDTPCELVTCNAIVRAVSGSVNASVVTCSPVRSTSNVDPS